MKPEHRNILVNKEGYPSFFHHNDVIKDTGITVTPKYKTKKDKGDIYGLVGASKDTHGCCPYCGKCQDGPDVAEVHHKYYSPPYKYSRLIGIETGGYDGCSQWQCVDCNAKWSRWDHKRILDDDILFCLT